MVTRRRSPTARSVALARLAWRRDSRAQGTCGLIGFLAYSSQLVVIVPSYASLFDPALLVRIVPFNLLLGLLWWNYALCVRTDPGAVPRGWSPDLDPQSDGVVEVKRLSGRPRFCRSCNAYKPPRAHHCRQCKRSVDRAFDPPDRSDACCEWTIMCVREPLCSADRSSVRAKTADGSLIDVRPLGQCALLRRCCRLTAVELRWSGQLRPFRSLPLLRRRLHGDAPLAYQLARLWHSLILPARAFDDLAGDPDHELRALRASISPESRLTRRRSPSSSQ